MIFNNSKNKPKQSCLWVLFQAFLLFVISTILTIMAYTPGKPSRAFTRQKACFSNLRIIKEAIKMYNQENPEKITELKDSVFKLLVENRCLKMEPNHPEPKCKYLSSGDITKDGYIYCEYHGDLEGKLECEFSKEYDIQEHENYKSRKTIMVIAFCIGPALLFILANLL